MKTKIVRIGNTHYLRIPQALVKKCHLEGEIDMRTEGHRLVIQCAGKPRRDWKERFKEMARNGDDALDAETVRSTKWEKTEWEW